MSFPSQSPDLMEAREALSSNMLWLLKNRVPAVSAALMARENVVLSDTSILECFQAADPTMGKLCAQWLMDTYLVGGFRHEDIRAGGHSKAHDTLSLFGEHRLLLPKAERYLLKYKSLGSLYAAVRVHVEAKNKAAERSAAGDLLGRALHRRERDLAFVESRFLYKGKSLTVAVPLTERAAKWWGKGTRWCTSADKDNAFRTYNDEAPLVIMLLRMQDDQGRIQVRKFQLYVTDDDVQFMDDNDDEVTLEVVSQHWDTLEPLIMWALERNGQALNLVPYEKRTGSICLKAVRSSINESAFGKRILAYVPEYEMTYEICLAAVEAYGLNLHEVPNRFLTDALLLAAVSQHAGALSAIKPNDRTYPLCLAAMTQCGNSLSLIPKTMWTPELLLAAASSSRIAFSMWNSEIKITYEMHLATIAHCADSLNSVPLQFWTLPLLMAAVKNDPWILRNMISHMDLNSLDLSPHNDYFRVYEVSDEYLKELHAVAVSINGLVLMHVSRHLRDNALNLSAVTQNGLALMSVLPTDMSKEIVLTAMRQNILAAEWAPDDMLACPEAQELLAMDARVKAEAEAEVARNGYPIVISWDISTLDDLQDRLTREVPMNSKPEDKVEDASSSYAI